MTQQERITAMADIMVKARQANEDVGELIAAALQIAAEKLGSVEEIVRGRPGSWEADIVRRMASAGGIGNKERVEALAALFVMMAEPGNQNTVSFALKGEAGEDGGDVLSQAMGEAVNKLGGLEQFAGTSQWYYDLTNMGRQYSDYWDA